MMMMMMMTNNSSNNNNKRTTHSQSKPPSPEYRETYRSKIKKSLNKRGNKKSDMLLYVLQAAFYTKYSHTGHCTNTSESAHVEIQWSQRRN